MVEEGEVRCAAVGIRVEREDIPRAAPAQRFGLCRRGEKGECQPRKEMLSQFHVVPSVFPIRRRADPVGPRSLDRWRLTALDLKLLGLMSTILSTIMLARIHEFIFRGKN
ncbi:hypothetical protein D3C71_1856380 [compost metagenome]